MIRAILARAVRADPHPVGANSELAGPPSSTGCAPRTGLLVCLESLPWQRPDSLQVLIHDEEDDCFGLWMIHDGKLEEITLPRTQRFHDPAPPAASTRRFRATCGAPTRAAPCPTRPTPNTVTHDQPGNPDSRCRGRARCRETGAAGPGQSHRNDGPRATEADQAASVEWTRQRPELDDLCVRN